MLTAADLPDDIAALKALLLASERRVQERDDQVAGLEAQLNTRAAEIEHLKLWIAKLRRMQFGRKSEKLDHQIEQLELQLEDLQTDEGELAKALPEADRAPRNKPVRKPLPEHCRAMKRSTCPPPTRARLAVVDCAFWARTWSNSSNMYRPASE
jgi:septal ring factor EnvC (AmiA/AmiB activator)